MPETLYLIDGHAQIYRAFFAVDAGLSAPDGRPTNAVLGFTRILLDIDRRHRPDYLAVALDLPGKTFRHRLYEQYKANRPPTPEELHVQVPIIREIIDAYRIPVFSCQGYEADDLLGTVAVRAVQQGVQVVLVTGDKDCGQLIGEQVRLYDAKNNRFTGLEDFTRKRGIEPRQLTDLMGLWGDASDNIPGVPTIGEKIGTKLIKRYGSLDNLLAHADEIKGKRGELLRKHMQQALLSKRLATIDTNAPIEFELQACRRREPDRDRLTRIFQELGLRSLLRMLDEDDATRPPGAAAPGSERDYVLVDTPEKFEAFFKVIRGQDHFAVDTETTGLDPMRCDLVGVSVSWAAHSGYYLPLRAPQGEPVLDHASLRRLGEVLADPDTGKVGQNIKFDALVLRRSGVELRGIAFDTLLASNLLEHTRTARDLDSLAMRYLGITKTPISDLLGSGRRQLRMDQVPAAKVCEYACEDADVALRLADVLERELEREPRAAALLRELELPLSLVLQEMQFTGIRVDPEILARQGDELEVMLRALTAEIHALAGCEFNIASPKQLGEVLYDKLGMPVVRRTKTGPSTDENALAQLVSQGFELPRRILDYRTYAKLKNTYIDALPRMINPATGRIHTTFSQTMTATGRLSSRDPNLQNIPVRTREGRSIRAAFVPEPGWSMLAADYSQVELRMLAHYCEDEVLARAFAAGQDIHAVVAAQLNGIPQETVTDEQRSAAKAVNFGIIYGQTPHGLARATGMNLGAAKDFIDSYFARFPRIREFIDATVAAAGENRAVRTLLGRTRRLPDLKSSNKLKRARAQREAVNTVIQGSAADLIKTAMVNLHARMRSETPRSRMLLQIHDELVFESPPAEVERLQHIVREEMENAMELRVPLRVELGVGENWLEAK